MSRRRVQPTFPVVPSPLLPPPSQARSRRTLESGSKLSIHRSYLLFSLSSFSIPHSPFQRLFVQGRHFYSTQQLQLVDLPILILRRLIFYAVLLHTFNLIVTFPSSLVRFFIFFLLIQGSGD
jgi:hypothetical protein